LHRGVTNYQTHNAYSDMILRLEETLIDTRGKRAYVGAYWSAVDSIAHSYGAHNRYTHTEIRTQILALRDLLNNPEIQDGRTVFMLIADHGHYDAFNKINVNDDPVLRDSMVFGLSGDARFAYLHLQPHTETRVTQHIDHNYADKFTYIPKEQALVSGLFGNKLSTKSASRIGDYILVPRLGYTIEDFTVLRLPLISWHAGLSDWEMLVPFIWRTI
jgi:predicted AlkP superfamily pyrophosphatase or phosphodiesterase